MKLLTLCIIKKDDKLLLGLKKRGFGVGRWNGFGGKVEVGETIEDAAKREVREESGVNPLGVKQVGVIDFRFKGDPEVLQVHIFRADDYEGEPAESDEMRPQWYGVDELPFGKMWPDDEYWLPLLLSGKSFRGNFLFDGQDTILEKELNEVETI